MAQTEFRKLKRLELVDIIYKLQEGLEAQKKETEELKKKLADRELKMEKAGSIAQAAVALNELMETAQRTADQYLISVRGAVRREELEASQRTAEAAFESERLIREAKSGAEELRKKAETEAKELREKAEAEAKEILEKAETEAKELREKAEADAAQIRRNAHDEAEDMKKKISDAADEIRQKISAGAEKTEEEEHQPEGDRNEQERTA